jgi:hypothetical protein
MSRTAMEESTLIDLRRRRMDQLLYAIMREITHDIPPEFHRFLHHSLETVLHENGAHIMTDQDRADFGLEPRDGLGWTPSERVKLEHEKIAAMYQMQNIIVTKDGEPKDG